MEKYREQKYIPAKIGNTNIVLVLINKNVQRKKSAKIMLTATPINVAGRVNPTAKGSLIVSDSI
jgi:hypothetical protein